MKSTKPAAHHLRGCVEFRLAAAADARTPQPLRTNVQQ
jgi:hypothetical protein